jgi:hypothetical protein
LFQSGQREAGSLSNGRKDFPRHERRRNTEHQNENCYPCLCPHVLPMSMPRAVRADVTTNFSESRITFYVSRI